MNEKKTTSAPKRHVDPWTTIVPFCIIFLLCALFVIRPKQSTDALGRIRGFLGDEMGLYYLIVALGIFIVSLWISFSDIGGITLGKPGEKPKYGFWTWGAMVFTCGLAADILFYSFSGYHPSLVIIGCKYYLSTG